MLSRIALAALNALEALKAVAVLTAKFAGNAHAWHIILGSVVVVVSMCLLYCKALLLRKRSTEKPGLSIPRNPRFAAQGLSPL